MWIILPSGEWRCGLGVEKTANLTLDAIDFNRNQIMVSCGKGGKDKVVYLSNDAAEVLAVYLRIRPFPKEVRIFLVEKGVHKGQHISVIGIPKRVDYYSRKAGSLFPAIGFVRPLQRIYLRFEKK